MKEKIKRETVTEKTGSTRGKLVPTPIGELLAGFLTDNFENIVDYQFTANIEEDLDKIADHKLERVKMLRDFYGPFSKEVTKSDDAKDDTIMPASWGRTLLDDQFTQKLAKMAVLSK